jgi:molybdopterin-biosynthesis enzyme MoeA-like protein
MGGGGAARGIRRKKAGLKRTSGGKLKRVAQPTSKRRMPITKAYAESLATRAESKSQIAREMKRAPAEVKLEVDRLKRQLGTMQRNPSVHSQPRIKYVRAALEKAEAKLTKLTSESSAGKQGTPKPWKRKPRPKTRKPIKR